MPQADNLVKRKGRAKNNLSTFDVSKIEADLFAVEAETLKLDPKTKRNEEFQTSKSDTSADKPSVSSVKFKPHPVNVVDFNLDNSKLLHRVLRSDVPIKSKPSTVPTSTRPNKIEAGSQDVPIKLSGISTIPAKEVEKPQMLKVSTTVKNTSLVNKRAGMDGFKKPAVQQIQNSSPAVNLNSVALRGMEKVNQFNNFSLAQNGTSLQNQIEKKSLFEKSLDGNVEIYDHGLQTSRGKKVYNVKRSKTMLGGVDQHNLGPGKVRKILGYRSVKFLMPVFAVFFIGAYVMYLNVPSINIKIAESKSGVAISEPGYVPQGYRLSGPIEADTGQVEMIFKNGDEAYNVSQKVSDWDSKALLENKVLKETKEYSAYTDRGLTIYAYNGKAVWVNQGKVYEIKLNKSQLEVEEMIRIAGSL